MPQTVLFAVIFLVQVFCALFFVSDILLTALGVRATPIPWQIRELLEIGASVGLTLGVVLGGVALRYTIQQSKKSAEKLRMVSAAFMDVVEERFADWRLTAAEKDVALFLLKGMSTQEIADLRQTSDGTVKAQTNAIYRKAGVTGRPQLLSLFIDDLMDDASLPTKVDAVTYAAK
jgi:DNA-binding CsgD family transcriptional regulator